jgi:hypothetical protein
VTSILCSSILGYLVLDHVSLLGLLITAQLELLTTLQWLKLTSTTLSALKAEHNLLSSFGLLVKDRLGLTTETRLLADVTALALSLLSTSAHLVLRDFVGLMLAAISALTKSVSFPWNIDHDYYSTQVNINAV